MARPDKTAAVAELVGSFNEAAGAVLTEYRGLTVKQLQDLRRALGENAQYAVVKNTLTQIAAKQAGLDGVEQLLTGPTAIAFIHGDVVGAAKGLRDFATANPALVIKGGYLEGAVLDASEIARIADLESREALLGKLAGAMLASLSQAVYLLNAPLAQAARVVGALQAKAEQDPSVLGGSAAETPAAESGQPGVESADTAPADTAPAETASADTAPAETASADAAPAETASADAAPADTASADTAGPETAPTEVAQPDAGPAEQTVEPAEPPAEPSQPEAETAPDA